MIRAAFAVVVFTIRHGFRAVAVLFRWAVAVAPLAWPVYAAAAGWLAGVVAGLAGWVDLLIPALIGAA